MDEKTFGQTGFKKILALVDGSENSYRAAKVAASLARGYGSELIILHAITTPPYMLATSGFSPPYNLESYFDYMREQTKEILTKAAQSAEREGVKVKKEVLENVVSVVQAITGFAANEKIDLIVMGTRGLGGFKKLLLGSISSGVVNHANCSVLVVR